MTAHTITLAGPFSIAKGPRNGDWRAEVQVPLADIPANIVLDLALHGLKQKIADAAAGATDETTAVAAMQKAMDAILKGEWSSRVAGSGVNEETRVARSIAKQVLKAKLGAKSAGWKEFTDLADDKQTERLDAIFAKNETALRPAVDKRLKELAAEREERKAMAGLSIDL